MTKSQNSKICPECNRNKGVHLYYKQKARIDGLSKLCKHCTKQGAGYKKGLDTKYKREFEITLDEYTQLLEDQDGVCYICRKPPRSVRLAVDHDHEYEKLLRFRGDPSPRRHSVRGLICRKCNEYLGHIDDSYSVALHMREYLRRPLRFPSRRENS